MPVPRFSGSASSRRRHLLVQPSPVRACSSTHKSLCAISWGQQRNRMLHLPTFSKRFPTALGVYWYFKFRLLTRALHLRQTNSVTVVVSGWTTRHQVAHLQLQAQCRFHFNVTEVWYWLFISPQTPQQRATQAAAVPWVPRQTATASLTPTPWTTSASTWQPPPPPPMPSSSLSPLYMADTASSPPAFGIPGGVFPSLYSQSTNTSRRVNTQRGHRQKPYSMSPLLLSHPVNSFGNALVNTQYSLSFLPYSVSPGVVRQWLPS